MEVAVVGAGWDRKEKIKINWGKKVRTNETRGGS